MTGSLKTYLANPSEDAGYTYFRCGDVAFCRDGWRLLQLLTRVESAQQAKGPVPTWQ
jgi:hypothetical protein